MIKKAMKFILMTTMIFGLTQVFSANIYPFFLERPDGSTLEGYITLPSKIDSPIVFAIQGSACQSVLQWHQNVSDHSDDLGMGVMSLEKRGISRTEIDSAVYQQTNSLQNREEDYLFCLRSMRLILPNWEGKMIFWGESEGGTIAAHLADQLPNSTAAVLLFGAGGGMKPKEEVKWAVQHRLQTQGATQDEIDHYMLCVEEQIQAMMLDPTADKEFWGNTYKWWASFLGLEEVAIPLKSTSMPICLVHGVEDMQVPVESADIAARMLAPTNQQLTYLRLEGYGHDLDTAAIRDAAYRWLMAVLFDEEMGGDLVVASENTQRDVLDDSYSRGKKDKDKDKEKKMQGHAEFGASGTEKDVSAYASGGLRKDLGNGFYFEGEGKFKGGANKYGYGGQGGVQMGLGYDF